MGDVLVLTPLLILGGGAVLVYLAGRLVSTHNGFLASVTAAVYALALGAVARLAPLARAGEQALWPAGVDAPAMLRAEPGAVLVGLTGLALGLAVAVYSGRYLSDDQRHPAYYPLLLMLSFGALGLPLADDLFVLYLFAVISGAASYVLVAFRRHTETAIEAGFKYVVMGSAAAVLALMGVGFLYRAEGTLSLARLGATPSGWKGLGIGLVCAGWPSRAPWCRRTRGCPTPTAARPRASAPSSPASSSRPTSMPWSRSPCWPDGGWKRSGPCWRSSPWRT
ncbi:MAG: hypothetical protein GX649_10030 [Chloroflexi bacterium]|nr:hypothetical protein [Chloroflexota bacterium]